MATDLSMYNKTIFAIQRWLRILLAAIHGSMEQMIICTLHLLQGVFIFQKTLGISYFSLIALEQG